MQWTDAARVAALVAVLAVPSGAQPAPQPLSILDVPFISQSEALCGGAAAAMVLRYWGERGLNAESFAHLVDRSAAGIRTTALVAELRALGWNATGIEGTVDQVSRELASGRPVLALIEDRPQTFHYVVIVAGTPGTIVFHDPARAPLRVLTRGEFARRWTAAGRWMAVIVPGTPTRADSDVVGVPGGPAFGETHGRSAFNGARPPSSITCDQLISEGVAHAQGNDLSAAERSLTAALTCPGPAAVRELAGVRLLQRRWPEVTDLASAAVAVDPGDAHAWRLLATSRFIQNAPVEALEAWNRVGEPRIDLIAVAGLTRTRQRVVEQLIRTSPGEMLTSGSFALARRRLGELPAATATRLEYVPVPSGLAELRATVNERAVLPADRWSYAAIGLRAAANRDISVSTGSLTGGGERLSVAWRFWPGRPRVDVSIGTPSRWGIWVVEAFSERHTFDAAEAPPSERAGGRVGISNWVAPQVHVALRGGLDRWGGASPAGTAGAAVRIVSRGAGIQTRASFDLWRGGHDFALFEWRVTARSATTRRGAIYVARGGVSAAGGGVPRDLRFAGDTGQARDVLLRAHPVLEDGRLMTGRLGTRIAHLSMEAQRWWRPSVLAVAAAAFVDGARVGPRAPRARGDVDAGVGARLAVPAVPGTFRADLAKGLRDGKTTFSFVYEP